MYAITGISGKVGGALAAALLQAGLPVRAVLRNPANAAAWIARGCDVAIADMTDADALARAFAGTEGAFILPPPEFDPTPGFPEARAVIDAVTSAIALGQPAKVVCLSTIGAQSDQQNLLTQRTLMEQALRRLPLPVTLLRPGWFMENLAWDVASARDHGVIDSYLQPLERAIPMVATADVGRVGAQLLREDWTGLRVVELEGPQRVSPLDAARAFAEVLGRPVTVRVVPRERWGALFTAQGMRDPIPRIQMLDGFNEGWIDFEGPRDRIIKGQVALVDVVRALTTAVSRNADAA
ncbi:NmrA family NAD(P)-binding protein [Achromobacter xylosoxidans]|uniref:NmrA family NAD(P)-binding protein n=1 Tax=Alcaligenes xylosoxydans xylosoxydans TaxID=85698 RepID=UPI00047CAFE7|nr:NmrA family NAD(P)-binding protein [Achromobacter xylosoxidans]MCH4593656.1 NAD(P)H-binding protein [Achromobacter xylosoxidans]CUI71099.1 Quinone oxidoreductase 2 [Achromobacter xylosoxidans]